MHIESRKRLLEGLGGISRTFDRKRILDQIQTRELIHQPTAETERSKGADGLDPPWDMRDLALGASIGEISSVLRGG